MGRLAILISSGKELTLKNLQVFYRDNLLVKLFFMKQADENVQPFER